MSNGKICWTTTDHAVGTAKRYSAEAWLARLDIENDSPRQRHRLDGFLDTVRNTGEALEYVVIDDRPIVKS